MEDESSHVRYLVVFALILCAVIIGYNAFYVPDASLTNLTVITDAVSSAVSSAEEYTPKAPASSVGSSSHRPAGKKQSSGKINLNTASAQQLSEGLNGVGEVMAKRIVEYREAHGRFRSVDDLKNVSGIGEKIFQKLKDQVTV